MLYFLPGAIPLLPRDIVAYEWYYYPFARRPRVELYNFSESRVGEQLRARGIEYWGCPMNGAFRFEPLPHFRDRLDNITSWWRQARHSKAAGFLVTSWEPQRLAVELTTVIDAAAASLWLDPGTTEPQEMLERGFARVFGRRQAKAAARVALEGDAFPFGGYPRWQINARWDAVSRREPLAAYRREEKDLARIVRMAKALPAPLRASAELRHYLAIRDVFVRRAARGLASSHEVAAFNSALRKGLRAARKMWDRTRTGHGPNEEMLLGDAEHLRAWRRGEPVFGGRWQLFYVVENFAPAAQLVAVEQRLADGSWATRQACHTIEFQARGARRRGGLTREHAAPVEWDGNTRSLPRLRFVLRGSGQVRIARVELTDGHHSWQPRWMKKTLGRRAPQRGWIESGKAGGTIEVQLRS
jgi:hypothetical protein